MTPEELAAMSPSELEAAINNGTLQPAAPVPPLVINGAASDVFDGFDFKDPVELLFFLDDNIASGKVKLHPWQIQFMTDFASGNRVVDHPFQALVRACNGSGKDKYVIAPCVVWLCMRYVKARGVVTSSSGDQLDNQTGTYIDQLCEAANRKFEGMFGQPVWKLNYRYYECLVTSSPIKLFATDEPTKAEGYHPLEPDAKMGIFVSEDKSVPDDINIALNRCTGYTHRVHVSTPGPTMGHFYTYCQTSVRRDDLVKVEDAPSGQYVQYHVTAAKCPHIPLTYINQMKRDLPGGEYGAAFQSIVMAEFGTSSDDLIVIPYTFIWRSVNNPKIGHIAEPFNTGGLDLSAGGDETVFSIRNGNKLIKVIPFKFDNTQDTIRFLEEQFHKYGFADHKARIFADAGGLGKPIIDQIKEKGWQNIRYVLNQSTAFDPRVYVNRGAEMWFNFGKLLESGEVWLSVDDQKLMEQLSTRYYKITPQNKHQLESKMQARAKGHPSPDRADSVVLAFSSYLSKLEAPDAETARPFTIPDPEMPKSIFNTKEYANRDTTDRYTPFSKGKDFQVINALITRHNDKIKSSK